MKTTVWALLLAMATLATASFAEAGVIGETYNQISNEPGIVYQVSEEETLWEICARFIPGKVTLKKIRKRIGAPNGITDLDYIIAGRKIVLFGKDLKYTFSALKAEETAQCIIPETNNPSVENLEKKNAELGSQVDELAVELNAVNLENLALEAVAHILAQQKNELETNLQEIDKYLSQGIFLTKKEIVKLAAKLVVAAIIVLVLSFLLMKGKKKHAKRRPDERQITKEEFEESKKFLTFADREDLLDREIRRLVKGEYKE